MGITKVINIKTIKRKEINIMSKSTKIIAALGVVAGLGVAALPAFTYAASTDGAVKLEVEVEPGIAMTIHSNGDLDDSTTPATEITYYNANPAAAGEGFGVDDNELYTKESGLFTNWSSAKTSLSQNQSKEDMTSVVTVYTNNAAGYTLTVQDEDSNNNLVSGSDTIAPIAANASLEAGTAGGQWGIKGGDVAAYTAVPALGTEQSPISPLTLKANGARVATTGEATTFTYGVATSATQNTGTYADVIVYTATTK